MTPRRAVESQLYAGVLEAPAGDLVAWYGSLSESEKDAEAAKGESALRALAEEHAEEPSPAPAQSWLLRAARSKTTSTSKTFPNGTGWMSSGRRSSDEDAAGVYWQSAILRQAFFSALLISVALAALAVLGLFARPHWLWAVPIVCTLLSLVLALRLRLATTYGIVANLSAAVLVLVVAAGSLEGLSVHLTHRS